MHTDILIPPDLRIKPFGISNSVLDKNVDKICEGLLWVDSSPVRAVWSNESSR